jgi:creatinine amidohydrolase
MHSASRFAELTRTASRDSAAGTLVVLPLGAIEQHGPHLPVGTDFFQVEALASRSVAKAAEKVPVCLAPALPFGCSQHHLPFGGTMSLTTETYYRMLLELTTSLVTAGYRRILLLNGHGGNHEIVQLVARDVALTHPVVAVGTSWFVVAWDALVALDMHRRGRFPGHAGFFETSLIMSLRPDLVKLPFPDRTATPVPPTDPRGYQRSYRVERHGAWQAIDGVSDPPEGADADMGGRCLEAVVDALAAAMIDLHRVPLPDAAGRGPATSGAISGSPSTSDERAASS